MENIYKAILNKIDYFTFRRDKVTVFRDVVHFLALDLSIKTDLFMQRERKEEKQETLNQYTGADAAKFLELKDLFFEMLKNSYDDFGDHLGHIYMQLIPKARQSNSAQFFTPYPVSKLVAMLGLQNSEEIRLGKVKTINDCCCGAGGMLIATCELLKNQNIDYTHRALLFANDIDITCVEMTYLQLSFLGASALIEHKDTISQKKWTEFRTFALLNFHTPDSMAAAIS